MSRRTRNAGDTTTTLPAISVHLGESFSSSASVAPDKICQNCELALLAGNLAVESMSREKSTQWGLARSKVGCSEITYL
ncbi:MAG: hypothetical protein RL173_2812 [Fibrobacterota bacterium]|jgi:hypothetical protein